MTDCAICFSEVTAATGRTVMSCGHEYHMRCLFQWLQKPDGSGNCPCCRHEPTEHERLVAPSADDSDSEYSDDESETDMSSFTALMRAAYAGDAALVERLLATGGVGADGEGGRTEPVPLAVLLEERDADGDTALIHAINGEHAQVVNMLIAAGANIDTRNEAGATPLIWAIQSCESDEIPLDLLRHGADVTPVVEEEGYSALEFAAEYDMVNVLQAILECGVGHLGEALHIACACNSPLCAAALLEAGADPNYRLSGDSEVGGMTPLMQCVSKAPHDGIVTALIQHGADVNATDNMGWNTLMWMTRADDAPDPDIMASIQDAMSRWERGADGRWRDVAQSWGEGDAAPPPYRLAEHTRAAARKIQAIWRGWSTRRRMQARPVAEQEAAMALCYMRLQITVADGDYSPPPRKTELTVPISEQPKKVDISTPKNTNWIMERMTRVV